MTTNENAAALPVEDYFDSVYTIDVDKDTMFCKEGEHMFRIWLNRDGVTVGYMHGRFGRSHFAPYEEMVVDLHDIETRPDYRNQGVAKKIVEMTKAYYGVEELTHSGGYTPEGADFASKLFSRPTAAEEPGMFNSMNFVHDWDKRYAM